MNLESVISKSSLAQVLEKKVETLTLNQAYLFVCEDETLRKEFCKFFIKKILNNSAQVEALSHPDLSVITGEKQIGVKEISELLSSVYYAPIEAQYKVYFIDDFSLVNEQAQNKLLKTIENPPRSVIFILGASSDSLCLPTIISRVEVNHLEGLTEREIEEILIDEGVDHKQAQITATMCKNSLKLAHDLTCDKFFIELYFLALEQFKMNSSREILGFLSKINLTKMSLNSFFNLTISFARDIMMILAGKENLVNAKMSIDDLKLISKEFSLTSITKIIEEAMLAQENLSFFVNSQAVLDEFLLKEVEVKVTCRKL